MVSLGNGYVRTSSFACSLNLMYYLIDRLEYNLLNRQTKKPKFRCLFALLFFFIYTNIVLPRCAKMDTKYFRTMINRMLCVLPTTLTNQNKINNFALICCQVKFWFECFYSFFIGIICKWMQSMNNLVYHHIIYEELSLLIVHMFVLDF